MGPRDEPFIPKALGRLAELYPATDKPDQAKKWQAERARCPATTGEEVTGGRVHH